MIFPRKFVLLAAAAVAAAACGRVEVADPDTVNNDVQTPVYFQTAPVTKAGSGSWTNFSEDNVFQSAAWYLEKGKTWEQDYSGGIQYIPASEVSNMDGTTAGTKVWRTVKPYYWPKNGGTLTFFSWSLNRPDLKFDTAAGSTATVEISKEKGVELKNFDITIDKGIDFLVADPAENKTKNEHLYFTDGVPTLFRHKLSAMKLTAQADDDYEGKTITIKTITITGVNGKADYQEGEENSSGNWEVIDRWTVDPDSAYDEEYYDGSTGGTVVSTSKVTFGGEQSVFIPQDFTGDEILEITYEIYDETSGIKEEMTFRVPLKEALQTASGSKDGKFEPGKEYTVNLHFTLDLVYWDPAVQDWDTEDNPVTLHE